MNSTPFQALACPLDGEPLYLEGNTWRCAARHAFDVARQGYVNLLPVQHKNSRDPGDNQAMVEARRDFLDAGHYAPVARRLAGLFSNPKLLTALGPIGMRSDLLMTLALRWMGNLVTDDDRDRAARVWRWAGRRSVGLDSRPPFS